ncbi:MAG: SCO family protein [Planctomycetota bacterium]
MIRARAIPAVTLAMLPFAAAPATLCAQGPGHSPTKTIEVKQEAASMQDKIGTVLDTSLQFTDERGYPYTFRQLFPGERPVVLVPGYYACPDMCGQVLYGMLDALNEVDLAPGVDYQIVNVSIDPRETAEVAKARKDRFLPKLLRVGGDEAWRFLVGDEASIRALTQQVGFRYFWAEHDNRFAHPGALLFVTPQGKLSRVLTGTTFDPSDVRLAIVEASEGKIGTFWDEFRLNCLTFDPRTGGYALLGMTVMRIGGAVTVVVIALMIVLMLRREKKRAAVAATA